MLDAFFIEKVFYLSVLDFGVIVTFNLFDFSIKLILYPFQELLYHLLSFTLILQKEHLGETEIVINNNKTVFVTTKTNVGDRTKQVHV
jgi:hypothetical protein